MITPHNPFLCLAGDTRVRMADWSVKKIKDITSGEWVMGSNPAGEIFGVRVVNVFAHGGFECWTYNFGSASITCTPHHKLLGIEKGSVHFKARPVGGELFHAALQIASEDKCKRILNLNRKASLPVGALDTFDLEIDHHNRLFVLESGLISSNSSEHTSLEGDKQ